jgi:nucleotide-binding universal stress UspA family protein
VDGSENSDRAARHLIGMGTRGMGTVASLVLGWAATKIIHLAKIPVTLVK